MALIGADCEIVNDDIFHYIKQLLGSAFPGEDVYLVTPYLQLDTKVASAIRDAVNKGIVLHLLMRPDSKISTSDYEFLATERIDVRELQNLHAKVYWSQGHAIVTSMNLYRYSESHSHELAVIFSDRKSVSSMRESVDKWWKDAKVVSVMDLASRAGGKTSAPSSKAFSPTSKASASFNMTDRPATTSASSKGFCIRCENRKSFDKDNPLCNSCLRERNDWNKPPAREEEQKHCHRCGMPNLTAKGKLPSFAFPLCKECYATVKATSAKS